MSIQVKRRREAAAFLSTFTGSSGEILVDTTNNRIQVHDGTTPGGFPAAKLSEVVALAPLTIVSVGAHGSNVQIGILEELISLSGVSTNSTIQIPNRAIVLGVSSRTVVAITGAPSYGIGAVGGGATQFGGSLDVLVGAINSGVVGPTAFYEATNVSVTATSGSFTSGAVRISIHYILCGAATS